MTPGANVDLLRWPIHAQTRLRLAGCFPFSPEIAANREYRHPFIALHQHFYHGRMLREGGDALVLCPGDVTFSLPNVGTRYELSDRGHHWCVHLDPVAEAQESVPIPLHLPMRNTGAYVAERFRAIIDLHIRGQRTPSAPLLQTAASLSLQELILWLALNVPEEGGSLGPKSEAAVLQARAMLDERFAEPLTALQMTGNTGLSPNYLATRFRQRFGVTMDGYLLRRRVEVGKHLLLTTNLLVKEVAFQVGIADPQYFNKQFRRSTNLSPTAFRLSERLVK